jgi:D-sedoheptulose 7-phosphate isomerase
MVKNIRVLALDVDGVLTDGTAVLTESGGEEKRFSFYDLDAVTQARNSGLTLVLVTGEETAVVNRIAQRFRIERIAPGAKDKISTLRTLSAQLDIPLSQFCYIGDGDRDAPALSQVGLGLAPANATPTAKAAAHYILSRFGGSGAVAEAVSLLFQMKIDGEQTIRLKGEARRMVNDSLAAHQRLLDNSLPVIVQVAQMLMRSILTGHKVILFSDGSSAADARHVAGELSGRFRSESNPLPAITLSTDTSILTAAGNNWDFYEIFARQVRALARPGDVAVGIDPYGHSAAILRGLEAGKACNAATIGFTGTGSWEITKSCDLCFHAPADTMPRIRELHILAWHSVCELVEKMLVES